MAKSKAQKQQEAGWRKIRGELLHAFRAGSDEKVLREYGEWKIQAREQLWLDYLALPEAWRQNAMAGASVPPRLQQRLDLHAIEEQAKQIDQATLEVGVARRRMRL